MSMFRASSTGAAALGRPRIRSIDSSRPWAPLAPLSRGCRGDSHTRLFDRLSIGFYLAFGWIGLIACKPFAASLQLSTFILLAVGGVLYTVGVIFHVWQRLHFQNAIWHGFVVAAAGVHYFAVLDEIAIAHTIS